MNPNKNIIEVRNVIKKYYIKNSLFKKRDIISAVNDLSFDIHAGEILGIIGESGSGKTTIGELIVKLNTQTQGQIKYHFDEKHFRKEIQIVMQQSKEVFDPLMSVEKLLLEAIKKHQSLSKPDQAKEVDHLLISVGINPQDRHKKINTFSGGQLQRICIARALAVKPKVLILDEPVSALDVSVQGQIINLLLKLHQTMDLTYVMISHDLNIVRLMCHRIAVMRNGQLLEINDTDQIFKNPQHEYTKRLITDFDI